MKTKAEVRPVLPAQTPQYYVTLLNESDGIGDDIGLFYEKKWATIFRHAVTRFLREDPKPKVKVEMDSI